MNRWLCRLGKILSGCALALLLVTYGSAATPPTIALVVKSMSNEFFLQMIVGAQEYAVAHSGQLQLQVEGIESEIDVAAQEAIIKRLIEQKVDAIIVVPTDAVAMLPILMKAVLAGILVINLDNKLDDRALALEGVNIPFVGPSNFVGARSVGEHVARALPPGSKVGLIEGAPGSINARLRSDGFRAALRQANISIAGIRTGNWSVDQGRAAAQDLLNAEPDIRALLCGNDNMAIGAVQAVAEAHKQGQVLIAGYDHIPAIRPYLADGRVLATADQFPGKEAQYAIALALNALTHKKSQADLPSIVQTPVELVTRH